MLLTLLLNNNISIFNNRIPLIMIIMSINFLVNERRAEGMKLSLGVYLIVTWVYLSLNTRIFQ